MKKIYLTPEMELTECFMLRTAICSNTLNNNQPDEPGGTPNHGAPQRKVF